MHALKELKEIIRRNKSGIPVGICSVCSANEFVIRAAVREARRFHSPLLIEATANQVNQFGGYTGMTPAAFRDYVYAIAGKEGVAPDQILLGGDHLGPLVWKDESAEGAMSKAEKLAADYAEAGFAKIHLDTSMKLGGDPEGPLGLKLIAQRGARLCAAAEKAVPAGRAKAQRPVYVIGSEVPIPGGARTEEGMRVTDADDMAETVTQYRQVFREAGLSKAWENVIAVVVQPGVEFCSNSVHDYRPDECERLSKGLADFPQLVFEGHSTDYQKEQALKQMVRGQIAVLKVGPALTFALREGLLNLEQMERELCGGAGLSRFAETLESAMLRQPANWTGHYKGSESEKRLARRYSYSDRCRYYYADPAVEQSVCRLLQNLSETELPMPMISQFFPTLYWKIREGIVGTSPEELLLGRIADTLGGYYWAVTV